MKKLILLVILTLIIFGTFVKPVSACSPSLGDSWFNTRLEMFDTFPSSLKTRYDIEGHEGDLFVESTTNKTILFLEEDGGKHKEVPISGYAPLKKIESKKVYYYYEDDPFYQDTREGEWYADGGGYHDAKSKYVAIADVMILDNLEEIKNQSYFGDERPENVQIPESEPFTVFVYSDENISKVRGQMIYELNEDYDPNARADSVRACALWPYSGYITMLCILICPLILIANIVWIVIRMAQKKKIKFIHFVYPIAFVSLIILYILLNLI